MEIIPATKKDIKEIANLMLIEFAKPPFKEKAITNAVIKSLNFYFKIGKAFVAVMEEKIIGVVIFKIEQWWEGQVILIEDLAVKEEFKHKEIGKKLMKEVEKYARSNNMKKVSFTTNIKSSAVKFYKKEGYKLRKDRVIMEKKV